MSDQLTGSTPRFEPERFVRVTDNTTGDYVQIGPDRDGLDLVELRAFCGASEVGSITMLPDQAVILAREILSMYPEVES